MPMAVNRRDMMLGSLIVGGGVIGDQLNALVPDEAPASVADAHLHLFNAADLPVAGFVKYVYLSKYVTLPGWAAAAVDLFANFFRSGATTVAEEARRYGGEVLLAADLTMTPAIFGDRIARSIDQRVGNLARAGDPASADLLGSYHALSFEVAADSGIRLDSLMSGADGAPRLAAVPAFNRDTFRILAEKEEQAEGVQPGDVVDKNVQALRQLNIRDLSGGARLLGWGYDMLKPRSRHLDDYLRKFGDTGAAPALLINHLVDYDLWLGDDPQQESDHVAQIRLMAAIAAAERRRVDLRTFAGFCPLKHAIETVRRLPTTFDRLKALRSQGQIAGFKLYPPMGFLPIGNGALGDGNFDPEAPGRTTALDAWTAAGGGPGELGRALDASLRAFYTYCVEQRIPVMAHAGPGNDAGPNYGLRADPAGWERVVREYPLRLSLGHLVHEVRPFVEAANRRPPHPAEIWALHSSARMIGAASSAGVYGDLGYMPELISNSNLARDFFRALRTVFGVRDPELTRILYGTDWIMLGREPHNRRYLNAVRRGMAAAGYSSTQQRNILYDNAVRFLA